MLQTYELRKRRCNRVQVCCDGHHSKALQACCIRQGDSLVRLPLAIKQFMDVHGELNVVFDPVPCELLSLVDQAVVHAT